MGRPNSTTGNEDKFMDSATTTTDKNTLKLNPRKNSNAQVFEPATSVHREELEKVSKLIGEALTGMEVPKDAQPDDELNENEKKLLHQHDAIFIHGERGAGKTSFILSLKAALSSDKSPLWVDKVLVLDTLDPSLMEESEVFLAAVISNLLREVQRHQKNTKGGRSKPSTESDRTENLSKAFEQLGESLRVLFPGGQQHIKEQSADARGLAKELLKDAGSAIRLGERFHRFVMACAQELGVRAFVQPIDDVDTSFTRAWPVLETIRRFLSSKRFQVVLAGDLELFQLIVRQEKLSHLEKLATLDPHKGDRIHAEVDTLLHQYMLKLLAPQRRIRLSTLQDKIYRSSETKPYPVNLVIDSETDVTVPLEDVLKNLHVELFGWLEGRTDQKSSFMDPKRWPQARILPDNLRLAVRFLAEVADWHQPASKPEVAAERLNKLIDLFEWELREEGLNPGLLKDVMLGKGYGSLAEWMVKNSKDIPGLRKLDTTHIDLPVPERKVRVERIVLLIQAALHHAVRRNPGEALRQLGGIWRPVNDYVEGNYNGPSKDKTLTLTADEVCLALRLREAEPPWVTAWRTTALQMHISPLPPTDAGLIRLTQKIGTAQRNRTARLFIEHWRWDPKDESAANPFWIKLLDAHQPADREGTAVPLRESDCIPPFSPDTPRIGADALAVVKLFMVTIRNYQFSYIYLDFWKGITALGDILVSNGEFRLGESTISFRRFLSLYDRYVVRSAASQPGSSPSDDDDESTEKVPDPAAEGPEMPKLLEQSLVWLKSNQSGVAGDAEQGRISPSLMFPPTFVHSLGESLGRNLASLSENLGASDYTVAATLERWVSLFLNHLLIHEVRYRPENRVTLSELNVVQANDKNGVFYRNLDAVKDTKKKGHKLNLPAFRLWSTCPLLLACLEPKLRERLLESAGESSSATPSFVFNYSLANSKGTKLPMDTYEALSGLFVVPDREPKSTNSDRVTSFNTAFGVKFDPVAPKDPKK